MFIPLLLRKIYFAVMSAEGIGPGPLRFVVVMAQECYFAWCSSRGDPFIRRTSLPCFVYTWLNFIYVGKALIKYS